MSEETTKPTPAPQAPEVKVSSADKPPALDTKSDEPMDLNSALEQMAKARAAQYAADQAPKKEVTYEEFQKMIDSTPLFMRETPKESGEDNYVLEALKSMMFDGDGDGEYTINALLLRSACLSACFAEALEVQLARSKHS